MMSDELKQAHKCIDAFEFKTPDTLFRALVFQEGEFDFKVVFYRKGSDAFSVDSVNHLLGYERPFLRGDNPPQLAAQHRELRLIWSFRQKGDQFRWEPDPQTIENGIRYTAGERIQIDKAAFAGDVLDGGQTPGH